MEKNNRKCLVCGKEYRYCPSCKEDMGKPTWKALYDNENCRTIFDILVAFNSDHITATDAKGKLEKCNLNTYIKPKLKKEIDAILETVDEKTVSIESSKHNDKKFFANGRK